MSSLYDDIRKDESRIMLAFNLWQQNEENYIYQLKLDGLKLL